MVYVSIVHRVGFPNMDIVRYVVERMSVIPWAPGANRKRMPC